MGDDMFTVKVVFETGVQFEANLKEEFGSVKAFFLDVQCQIFYTYLGLKQV